MVFTCILYTCHIWHFMCIFILNGHLPWAGKILILCSITNNFRFFPSFFIIVCFWYIIVTFVLGDWCINITYLDYFLSLYLTPFLCASLPSCLKKKKNLPFYFLPSLLEQIILEKIVLSIRCQFDFLENKLCWPSYLL